MIALTDTSAAASAFDRIAETYDSEFTTSMIGRSQREAVWRKATTVFRSASRILELNCGTGEDALFLARQGHVVTACDASWRMIELARERKSNEAPRAAINFVVLRSEHLHQLPQTEQFNAVFSNFSGLNCVADLSAVSRQLLERLDSGAPLLLCLSTRFCAWEMLHYLFRGNLRKAFRRCGGFANARVGDQRIPVFYPTLHSIRRSFGRSFRLRSVTGIGIFVPPSYMEQWARRHPSLFRFLEWLDSVLAYCPGLRVLGDHMLLQLERV